MNKKEKPVSDRSNSAGPVATSERERAIDLALQQIERRFGKGAIMKLGEASHIHVDVIPTGSIALDLALGIGECREAVSLRFMVRKLLVKRPCASILLPVRSVLVVMLL